MSNFRRRLMMSSGKKYNPVTYLQSTGTQYIDTGVKGNSEIKIDIIFEITNTRPIQFFFGSRQSTYTQTFSFISANYTDNPWTFRSDFNNRPGQIQTEMISNMTGYPLFHVIKDKNITTIENNEYINNISYSNFTSNYNIYIFTVNTNNNTSNFSYMKLYSFKVYNAGVLVRDFIPVCDLSNIPCLYDKVEDKFYYNKGSGEFLYE